MRLAGTLVVMWGQTGGTGYAIPGRRPAVAGVLAQDGSGIRVVTAEAPRPARGRDTRFQGRKAEKTIGEYYRMKVP